MGHTLAGCAKMEHPLLRKRASRRPRSTGLGQLLELCGEVPQKRRFVSHPQSDQRVAQGEDFAARFYHIIDVALRIDSAGYGEPHQFHRCRFFTAIRLMTDKRRIVQRQVKLGLEGLDLITDLVRLA